MKKILLSLVATVAATGSIYAQSYAPDALKFSQTNFGSTARFKSMGGAQIGVGGDISSLGGNPAGLGLFTKSEFSFTPEFNMMRGKANFLNQNTSSSKNNLNINNVGIVFYSPTYKSPGENTQTGVISTVFGIGFNRNNDFGARFDYGGTNRNNSISDNFVETANSYSGSLISGSLEEMASRGGLIKLNPTSNLYESALAPNNVQKQTESRMGSTSELNVGGAINIANQVYLGASLGFVNTRYINDSQYTESGTLKTGSSNYNLAYFKNQETKGSGVNGRLGVIFRPVSEFRIGATFQTPTWLIVEDNTAIQLNSKISGTENSTIINSPSNYGFSYRLKTPLKGSIGASYVIGGRALISADVDYIDYSSIRFSVDQETASDRNVINAENYTVKQYYKEAINFRLGAEYKVDNAVSLRAGYANNGSYLKGDKNNTFAANYYSGGVGYRFQNYYFDLAYQRAQTNTQLSPYILGEEGNEQEPVASIKTARNNVFLTFGVRF